MFEKMTVSELKVVAKVLRVDLGKATKKSDIVSVIESCGFTYEDYLSQTDEQFTYKDAEEKVEEPVIVKDETKSEDMVVLKMTYNRSALNVSNVAYFSAEEPYKVFSKEKANEILRLAQGEVMLATPEEVVSFYGVNK
jgi:hypothetical protein